MDHRTFWSNRKARTHSKHTREELDHHGLHIEDVSYNCAIQKANQLRNPRATCRRTEILEREINKNQEALGLFVCLFVCLFVISLCKKRAILFLNV